jgi:hypothetical protein
VEAEDITADTMAISMVVTMPEEVSMAEEVSIVVVPVRGDVKNKRKISPAVSCRAFSLRQMK